MSGFEIDLVTEARITNRAVVDAGRQFLAISADTDYTLGLLDNGKVVGWGCDYYGEISGWKNALERAHGRRYLSVTTCRNHLSMGLLDNGRVVFWGMRPGVARAPSGRHFV